MRRQSPLFLWESEADLRKNSAGPERGDGAELPPGTGLLDPPLAGGGGDPGQQILLRHRLGEQEALTDRDPQALELVALVRALDSFRHGLEAEPARQLDDGFEHARFHLVEVTVHHISAVDLELAAG